ncbi:MAG: arylesterase [Micavibrio sp.]|nr:arylesterase [Micavibrio sp.]
MFLRIILSFFLVFTFFIGPTPVKAQDGEMSENAKMILAYGDSLMAGYNLQKGEDFASQLEDALISDGHDVIVKNASISGDTTASGLSRLEWALESGEEPDLVILGLGANDMLRALPPASAKENLREIIEHFKSEDIAVLLAGMKAAPNLGESYRTEFDAIYPELADTYDNVTLYPFFLEDVATVKELNLEDGIHPNLEGINIIVENIKPYVVEAAKLD